MTSSSESSPMRFKDFRAIALAWYYDSSRRT
jgi:hypothetical protein